MHCACIFLISLVLVACEAGWKSDGSYTGAYPGGCVTTGECPVDERCMHKEEEIECPKDHQNKCRCTFGCLEGPYVLRVQQWRKIEGKGFCMCKNPLKNEVYCEKRSPL